MTQRQGAKGLTAVFRQKIEGWAIGIAQPSSDRLKPALLVSP